MSYVLCTPNTIILHACFNVPIPSIINELDFNINHRHNPNNYSPSWSNFVLEINDYKFPLKLLSKFEIQNQPNNNTRMFNN